MTRHEGGIVRPGSWWALQPKPTSGPLAGTGQLPGLKSHEWVQPPPTNPQPEHRAHVWGEEGAGPAPQNVSAGSMARLLMVPLCHLQVFSPNPSLLCGPRT